MPNKVYTAPETAVVFQESGGNVVITLLNMLTGVGRVSARYDKGTGSQPSWWHWAATFQLDTTPVVGELINLYVALSDGTLEDGDVGTADAAILEPVLANLHFIGSVVVQVATATVDFRASGFIYIPTRYFSIAVFNKTADSLENTANVNTISMTPIPDEIQ